MGAKIWWQAVTAVFAAVRRRTPAQEEALRAERARGVDRLAREVVDREAPAESARSRTPRGRRTGPGS